MTLAECTDDTTIHSNLLQDVIVHRAAHRSHLFLKFSGDTEYSDELLNLGSVPRSSGSPHTGQ